MPIKTFQKKTKKIFLCQKFVVYLLCKLKLMIMSKNDLEKLASMSQDEYMQQNPNYEPMFPDGWSDDSKWPEFKYDYESFRKIQLEIDDYNERMAGCYDMD